MTDLRKAAEMALDALEWNTAHRDDDNAKRHEAIEALRQALAQPEQVSIEPPDYVEPITFDYHEGWEEGFEAAKNLFKKESAPQNADPRLLLGRSNNFTKETENRLCDIERRLAAIETQPALAQPEQEVSYTDIQMAELIMSDCGHSSEYKPLLDRIAGRLATYRQELAQQEQRAAWQGNGGAGYNVGGTGVAKPEQEPVRWFQQFGDAPPKQWVGLHLDDMPDEHVVDRSFLRGARWAEVKLKEKNT